MASETMLIERGTVGRVADAYRLYIGGGQSEEPIGLTVHWQPEGSRGEHEQHVPLSALETPWRPQPGDQVLCLTNRSGGLVLAVVIAAHVCFNSTPYEDEELLALSASAGARHGGALLVER